MTCPMCRIRCPRHGYTLCAICSAVARHGEPEPDESEITARTAAVRRPFAEWKRARTPSDESPAAERELRAVLVYDESEEG